MSTVEMRARVARLGEALFLVVAAALLLGGGLRWVQATSDARHAQASLDRARDWNHTLHSRLVALKHKHHKTVARKQERQAAIRELLAERSTGFSDLRDRASSNGARVGEIAGVRGGRADATSATSALDDSGWYMVRIRWRDGLPVVDASWTVSPSVSQAIGFDNGDAWKRPL
jgi:hypothetical protein